MNFKADKQTLEDLNLLGKFRQDSVFSIFNQTKTRGGERLLENMFNHPLTNAAHINTRSALIRYFQQRQLAFPFDIQQLITADNYLTSQQGGGMISNTAGILQKKLLKQLVKDVKYDAVAAGLMAAIEVLNRVHDLLAILQQEDQSPFHQQLQTLQELFRNPLLNWLSAERNKAMLPVMKVAKYDHLLRNVLSREIEKALDIVYQLDVYIAVSDVARERGLSYAKALQPEERIFKTSGLWHPALKHGIANPLTLDDQGNMLFLTGANMAGKSTFMKAFGIAVYLGHMGFPVAAGDMQFSVRNGLFTSINVSDNLSLGYSHFYAEVFRVKTVAEEISRGNNLVVIFDELFKGTNVKDAYDATLSITKAFAKYHACLFMISTHIIEVGHTLQEEGGHYRFGYMPTHLNGKIPEYTYRLTNGITNDRQGMVIISNEGILDIIRSGRPLMNA